MFWYSKTSAKINMTLEEFLREFKEAGTKKKADLVEGLGDARGIIFTEMTLNKELRVMSEIGPKPASQLFNSVDADVRKKFLESLGGEKEITEFTDKIRKVAVADFWDNEKKLVMEGKGTYNWTPEQQKSILGPKGKAYIDVDGKSEVFQGHHMKNVADYPEYAADPNNIQPLWGEANVKGTPHNEAHNGKSTNPTMGYYDDSLKSMTDFTTEGLDNGYPPIIELTNPCDEVKEMETF